jgi:hypothetical protein
VDLTVKQVAQKLGLAPQQTLLSLRHPEKLGLIGVAETRMVANMVEKTYQSRADTVEVDPSLLHFSREGGNEPFNTAINSVIDATREDILRSLQARQFQLEQGAQEQPRRFLLNRLVSRLPEERRISGQTVALLQELKLKRHPVAEIPPYALTVAFYPSFILKRQRRRKRNDNRRCDAS